MVDEIKNDTELDNCWDAASSIDLQQLPVTDEACLSIPDYNDLKMVCGYHRDLT